MREFSFSLDRFYKGVGLTCILLVIEDFSNRVWDIHSGLLYPYRHLPIFPLYPTYGLALEWLALAVSGIMMFHARFRSMGTMLALFTSLIGLTQRVSNHRFLLVLVLVFLLLDEEPTSATRTKPPFFVGLLKGQLVIVYWATALNKIVSGFCNGTSLNNLFDNIQGSLIPKSILQGLSSTSVTAASISVVACELAIPLLLQKRPTVAIALAVGLHTLMVALMPGIITFSFLMLNLCLLWKMPSVDQKNETIETTLPEGKS